MRQYIGARYVPTYYQNSLDPTSSEWEANVQYDPLTIVSLPNLHSYQSKKFVPANIGSPASNPEYWYDQGYANAYFQALQDQIDGMQDGTLPGSLQNQINDNSSDIAALAKSIDPINFDIIVAADGSGDYTSLETAVAAANEGDRIFVKKGDYLNESVDASTKTLTIIGEEKDKVRVINGFGDYSRAPIEIASGYVKNIRFISSDTGTLSPAYAAHIDYAKNKNNVLIFDDCYFESQATYAVGIGTRQGGNVVFNNCKMLGASGTFGVLFVHPTTDTTDEGANQNVKLVNCVLQSTSNFVIALQKVGSAGNVCFLSCFGCQIFTNGQNKKELIRISGTDAGLVSIVGGAGNNYPILNSPLYDSGEVCIGRWGDKAVKRFIASGSISANTQKSQGIPSDIETLIDFNGYITATSTQITYPIGNRTHGSTDEYYAYCVLGSNTSYLYSSFAGNYLIDVVYVSSDTSKL